MHKFVPKHPRHDLPPLPTLTPEERVEGKRKLTQHINDFLDEHRGDLDAGCSLSDQVVQGYMHNRDRDPYLAMLSPVNWLPTSFVKFQQIGKEIVSGKMLFCQMLNHMAKGNEPTTETLPDTFPPLYKEALRRNMEFWRPERDFSALSDMCERLRSPNRMIEVVHMTKYSPKPFRDRLQHSANLLVNLAGSADNHPWIDAFDARTTAVTERLVYGLHNYNLDRVLANALVNPDVNYSYMLGKIDGDAFNRYSQEALVTLDRSTQMRGKEVKKEPAAVGRG